MILCHPLPFLLGKHVQLYPVTNDLPYASSSLLELLLVSPNQMSSRLSHTFPDSLKTILSSLHPQLLLYTFGLVFFLEICREQRSFPSYSFDFGTQHHTLVRIGCNKDLLGSSSH